jgi:hypothetical protein
LHEITGILIRIMPGNLFVFLILLILLYILSRKLTSELSFFIHRVVRVKKLVYFLFALLFLPGTIIHELAHYIASLLLFVPVGGFSLKPGVEGNSIKLGSVSVAKTDPVRSLIIGFAPFSLGLAALVFTSSFLINRDGESIWPLLLGAYIIFQIGNTMFLSKSDLKSAYKMLVLLLFAAVFLFVINKETVIYSLIYFLDTVAETLNFYLFLPIAVNFSVFLILKLARKILSF